MVEIKLIKNIIQKAFSICKYMNSFIRYYYLLYYYAILIYLCYDITRFRYSLDVVIGYFNRYIYLK